MGQLTDGRKKEAEALLIQNYSIETVAMMLHIPENSVRGVWAGLKRRGLVAREVKPPIAQPDRPYYADFLEGCVEDFFQRRGWKIVIRKTEGPA